MRSTLTACGVRPEAFPGRHILPLLRRIGRAAFAVLLAIACPAGAAAQPPQPAVDDPFARRAWTLELGSHGAVETWNYNISHENMLSVFAGVTYGVREGLVLKMASPLYYVWQRGTDGYLLGLTWGVRGRILREIAMVGVLGVRRRRVRVGHLRAAPRHARSTIWRSAGPGSPSGCGPACTRWQGFRWVHVSNNGLAGRSRNPDIEAVGPAFGLLVGF